eukprot:779350_1
MTNDEENNNEKEESIIDAGMSETEKESCNIIDYYSTDGCHGDGGWCRTNYVYKSYKVINGAFSVYCMNAVFSLLCINALMSILSVNGSFSFLSVNSAFSILSVNSFVAVGCNGEAFKVCF